jgi:hypothetical protein
MQLKEEHFGEGLGAERALFEFRCLRASIRRRMPFFSASAALIALNLASLLPLSPFPWEAWFAGKQKVVPPAVPGNAYLFHLSNNPTVGLNTRFSTVRLNISQSALDTLADERGLRRASGLYARSLGCPDAVMYA